MEAQKQKLKRTQKEISKPEDFTDPEVLYEKLINTIREYHPSTDLSMVEKAYKLARDAHKDQKRKSGEPYIIHPPVSYTHLMLGNIIPSGVSSIVCCDIIVLTICCTNVLEVITIRTIAISIFFIKRSKRQTLIPISQNPRTSIHISKIRMPVIYPGIKNSNRCPFASKCCSIYISSSHNIIIDVYKRQKQNRL